MERNRPAGQRENGPRGPPPNGRKRRPSSPQPPGGAGSGGKRDQTGLSARGTSDAAQSHPQRRNSAQQQPPQSVSSSRSIFERLGSTKGLDRGNPGGDMTRRLDERPPRSVRVPTLPKLYPVGRGRSSC